MQLTALDTPILGPLLRGLTIVLARLSGWRVEGRPPAIPKYVVIGAHHTSYWDAPIGLALSYSISFNTVWMVKDAAYRWPFRSVLRWIGALPIDRSRRHSVVSQMIEQFRRRDRLILAILPEGTRKRVTSWKTGFYHIARGAGVPIVLAFLDYRRKVGGFGPTVMPSGDIEADMRIIRDFYAGITPKHPERAGVVHIASEEGKPSTEDVCSTQPTGSSAGQSGGDGDARNR